MKQYLDLVEKILEVGVEQSDRTGVGTKNIFGHQMRFDLSKGFPLMTTKKIHIKSVIYELIWFLKGDTNTQFLRDNGVSIWNEWADSNGDLGPIYGKQWRSWPAKEEGKSIDQLSGILAEIKQNPNSRRLIVSAWNVSELSEMALLPCHCLFQFYVENNRLSLQLYQRSADVFLGVPFNIASYALLTHIIADQCNLKVGEFIWTGGVTHLYLNHLEQARKQLSRTPKELPTLNILRKPDSLVDYQFSDFAIKNYVPDPHIKAPVAV